MQNWNYVGRDQMAEEREFVETEPVRVDLPWVPLPYREGAFLTQVVLRDRAVAVRDAIELYMQCRTQPHFDVPVRDKLTLHLWHVLQAAHPHSLWQWWDWDQAYPQFRAMAMEFLGKERAA